MEFVLQKGAKTYSICLFLWLIYVMTAQVLSRGICILEFLQDLNIHEIGKIQRALLWDSNRALRFWTYLSVRRCLNNEINTL